MNQPLSGGRSTVQVGGPRLDLLAKGCLGCRHAPGQAAGILSQAEDERYFS